MQNIKHVTGYKCIKKSHFLRMNTKGHSLHSFPALCMSEEEADVLLWWRKAPVMVPPLPPLPEVQTAQAQGRHDPLYVQRRLKVCIDSITDNQCSSCTSPVTDSP